MEWIDLIELPHYFNYSFSQYPFARLIREMMKIPNNVDSHSSELQNLHLLKSDLEKHLSAKDIAFDDVLQKNIFQTDQSSCFHRLFYGSGDLFTQFTDAYHNFVINHVLPIFNTGDTLFAVQHSPTFRVQIPQTSALGNNLSVVEKQLYLDKKVPEDAIGLHNDSLYKHPAGEMNFIVPLTDMFDSNSTWVETGINSNTYSPIVAKPGQFFQFYGNQMYHFNKINTTGQTRVSFDFRVIPYSKMDLSMDVKNPEKAQKSMTSQRTFTVGSYYSLFDTSQVRDI